MEERIFQWGENPIGGKTLHFYTTGVSHKTGSTDESFQMNKID